MKRVPFHIKMIMALYVCYSNENYLLTFNAFNFQVVEQSLSLFTNNFLFIIADHKIFLALAPTLSPAPLSWLEAKNFIAPLHPTHSGRDTNKITGTYSQTHFAYFHAEIHC